MLCVGSGSLPLGPAASKAYMPLTLPAVLLLLLLLLLSYHRHPAPPTLQLYRERI